MTEIGYISEQSEFLILAAKKRVMGIQNIRQDMYWTMRSPKDAQL